MLRGIRTLLQNDRAPLVVSAFFAAFVWTVNKTVERVSERPVIEYEIRQSPSSTPDPGHKFWVRLENVSSKAVECVRLELNAYQLGSSQPIPFIGHASDVVMGGLFAFTHSEGLTEDTEIPFIQLERFSPRATYSARFVSDRPGTVRLSSRECEGGMESAKSSEILLLPCNFTTFFLRHEISIYWVAVFVLGALVLTMLFVAKNESGHASQT